MLVSISNVSAFEFDNNKEVKETIGKAGYPDIAIGNFFGLGATLWDGTLDRNTEICAEDCYSIITIELLEEGSLASEVIFETINKDGSRVEQEIKGYDFYIPESKTPKEVDDYSYKCLGKDKDKEKKIKKTDNIIYVDSCQELNQQGGNYQLSSNINAKD